MSEKERRTATLPSLPALTAEFSRITGVTVDAESGCMRGLGHEIFKMKFKCSLPGFYMLLSAVCFLYSSKCIWG